MTSISNEIEKPVEDVDENVDVAPHLEDSKQRNAEIYRLKQQGVTQATLARQFGLSPEWIRRICEEQERHEGRAERIALGSREKEDTDLYILLVEKNAYDATAGRKSKTPLQAYHCVWRKWHRDGNEGYPTPEYFQELTEEEIQAIPGVGKAIESFLKKVQEKESEV